jgi:hypothetical protein
MRRFLYLAAAIVWAGLGASAFGQGMGGGGAGGGTGTSGGAGGGGTGLTGGGNSLLGSSGGTSLLGGTGGTSTLGGTGGTNRTGTGRTGTGTFTPAQSNLFGGTYGNPLYNGRPGSTNLSLATPGGFGAPSYGTTTTGTGTGTTGRATGTGGRATVRSGMTGGTTGQTGAPTYVSHIAELKFPVAPVVPSAIQAELQGVINRTSMWKGPATVTVEMVGTTAVLRGRVSDADDKRMVEGMVRLTPGVRDVINEITSP